MHKYFTIILSLFISSGLCAQEFENLDFGTDSTFEVMTWNVEWFPSNGQITIDYVGEIIEALEIDLIAVQEIDDLNDFSEVDDYLEDWSTAYIGGNDFDGLAYFFRPEVIDIVNLYYIYTNNNREFPRAPLVFEFLYEGEFYVIINNHLKCCGDSFMDLTDLWDEETRRRDACTLLHNFVESNFPDDRVIIVGDWNDVLIDDEEDNVFSSFLNNPSEYQFLDLAIATGSSSNWSYPWWPSHLDHILISNEVQPEFESAGSIVETILLDQYVLGGLAGYTDNVSDHRPVAAKILSGPSVVNIDETSSENQEIYLFPNPVNHKANLRLSMNLLGSHVFLFDLQGRLVQSFGTSTQSLTSLDMGGIETGWYILKVKSPKGAFYDVPIIIE